MINTQSLLFGLSSTNSFDLDKTTRQLTDAAQRRLNAKFADVFKEYARVCNTPAFSATPSSDINKTTPKTSTEEWARIERAWPRIIYTSKKLASAGIIEMEALRAVILQAEFERSGISKTIPPVIEPGKDFGLLVISRDAGAKRGEDSSAGVGASVGASSVADMYVGVTFGASVGAGGLPPLEILSKHTLEDLSQYDQKVKEIYKNPTVVSLIGTDKEKDVDDVEINWLRGNGMPSTRTSLIRLFPGTALTGLEVTSPYNPVVEELANKSRIAFLVKYLLTQFFFDHVKRCPFFHPAEKNVDGEITNEGYFDAVRQDDIFRVTKNYPEARENIILKSNVKERSLKGMASAAVGTFAAQPFPGMYGESHYAFKFPLSAVSWNYVSDKRFREFNQREIIVCEFPLDHRNTPIEVELYSNYAREAARAEGELKTYGAALVGAGPAYAQASRRNSALYSLGFIRARKNLAAVRPDVLCRMVRDAQFEPLAVCDVETASVVEFLEWVGASDLERLLLLEKLDEETTMYVFERLMTESVEHFVAQLARKYGKEKEKELGEMLRKISRNVKETAKKAIVEKVGKEKIV